MTSASTVINDFCQQQQLTPRYASMAEQWFMPLANKLAGQVHARKQSNTSEKPMIIGINGCQGSGKSTLGGLLQQLLNLYFQLNTVTLSIDDFYLTKDERLQLAKTVHPLLATRGVPGTHDIPLLETTITALGQQNITARIPRFNKAIDDRQDESGWDEVITPVDVIIFEGWCVGIPPLPDNTINKPINQLEHEHDNNGTWRRYIQQQLQRNYQDIFKKINHLIFLQAPSFDCVFQWRKKQEDKLRGNINHLSPITLTQTANKNVPNYLMNDEQLRYFIAHYERLTEHAFNTLPAIAHTVFQLNRNHEIEYEQEIMT